MLNTLVIIISNIFCLLTTPGYAAGPEPKDSILAYMQRAMLFNKCYPQEKVYLHFDNTGYFKGETIWFKAYVTRADKGKSTDISRVLYVELVTPNGEVVQKRTLQIDEAGQTHGELKLDSIYTTGFYEVRAYTRYMTNWGHTGIFSRVFPVFKSPKAEGDYSNPTIDRITYKKRLPNYRSGGGNEEKINAEFYPEGGNLVCGLKSRVAFTLTDKDGLPLRVKCVIKNSEGLVMDSATTDSLGRGLANVTPDGSVIAMEVLTGKGKREEFTLPEALGEGCTLAVQTVEGDIVTADISASSGMQDRMLGYVVVNSGNIVECDTFTVAADIMRIELDRSRMPAGVNQLTVFDCNGIIQAERLFFICPPKDTADSIRISARTQRLMPCGKVTLDVSAAPDATFSFSAMDNATMVNGKVGNAMTWMLLSSDVKGYIHNPDYYFESDDEEHRRAADLLMMVQGWRRYDWKVMTNPKKLTEKVQMIEDNLYVTGQLKARKKRHRVDNVEMEVYLFNRKGESLKGETVTDSAGRYAFKLPDINGEWNMQIVTRKDNSPESYFVSIDRHFSPAFRDVSPSEAERIPENGTNISFMRNMEQDEKDALAVLQKRDRVLPTVKVKAKRRFTDGARAAWESEKNAQHWASIHYDVDAEADKIADMGDGLPSLNEWLVAKNPYFSRNHKLWEKRKDECPNYHDLSFKERKKFLKNIKVWNENIEVTDDQDFKKSRKTIKGLETGISQHAGLTVKDNNKIFQKLYYKGQEVTIIINNLYYGLPVENNNADILRSLGLNVDDYTVAESKSKEEFPGLLNEVKAVYITEDPASTVRYIGISRNKPTVFIYTHHKFLRNVKGLRRTHFQGFNVPETFEMEDYSMLPPMEDFRRTLYWNPNVTTDSEGKATIEFYNNSSCTQMFISAEGITKDGKFIISEN